MMRPTVLALAVLAGCGPSTTTPRTLWLDVPVDGTVVLVDHQPDPF